MAMNPGEYTLLVNRIAQQHRIEQARLLTLTTPQLMALSRSLNGERDNKAWGRGLRAGFETITKQQQVGSAALATALYTRSALAYQASGMAPKGFKPKTPDSAKFLLRPAKVVYSKSHRELNYFTSMVEQDRFPRQKVIENMRRIAQDTLMNTSRELVLETAEEDNETIDSDWGDVEDRFESDEEFYARKGLSFDDDDSFDSLDLDNDDFFAQEDAFFDQDDEFDLAAIEAQADEEYERMMDEYNAIDEEDERLLEQESAMRTNVKPGGCDFCKLASNFPSFGQAALHGGCTCVGQPSWKAENIQQPAWSADMQARAEAAQDRIIADNKLREAKGLTPRVHNSTEYMREINKMKHEEKNAALVAEGKEPKKYQGHTITATEKHRAAIEKKAKEKAEARAERKAKEKAAWAGVPKEKKKEITTQRKNDLEELRTSQERIDDRSDIPESQKERMKKGMKTLYNKRDKTRRAAAMGLE